MMVRSVSELWRPALAWGLGLAMLAYVLAQPDYQALAQLLQTAGFALFAVVLLEPPRWASQALAWQLLFAPGRRPGWIPVFYASALGNAVNDLLPAMNVGGNLLKARYLVKRGVSGVDATAAGIVDISLHAVSALAWSLIGLIMISHAAGGGEVFQAALAGSLVLILVIALFVGAQLLASERVAAFLQRRFSQRGWNTLADGADQTQACLIAIWKRRASCLGSVLSRMTGRALMLPEILFVGWLLGTEIALWQAAALTGSVILVKTAGFMIPARIGVQEGAFLAVGALLGLPTESMFAIALAVRLREVLPQLPVLLVWWLSESRRLPAGRGHG